MATVFARVREIVAKQFGVDENTINPNTSFVDDLNADSLSLVEILMNLEEEFSTGERTVEISDEDAETIATVQDAVNYIKEKKIAQDDEERSS